MKISNSKKQLAAVIHENGGWRGSMSFSWYGNKTGKGYFGALRPRFDKASGSMIVYGVLGADVVSFECEKVSNWHQTILSREEYFHLYPVAETAPDADGWIEWNGVAKSPVGKGVAVDVKMKNGTQHFGQLIDDECWGDHWGDASIIAYRLHKPETEITHESDHRTMETPKPSIEQLAAEYRNLKDCADRKQQEADAAKVEADAKLKALELAGEAFGLLVSPITANQESELAIEVKVGDEVERLRGALHDAATSLETIHILSFGEESFLDSKPQMRSFAGARAKVAREALSE